MRGRKPTPRHLKIVRGNPGKRPLGDPAPRPEGDTPTCPDWLDADAKSLWASLAPRLAALGLLTALDGDLFAAFCQARAEHKQATEALQRDGRYLSRHDGTRASHPAVAQQRSAWAALRALGALFGLDPADRSRLDVAPVEDPDDPFTAFLNRGRKVSARNRKPDPVAGWEEPTGEPESETPA